LRQSRIRISCFGEPIATSQFAPRWREYAQTTPDAAPGKITILAADNIHATVHAVCFRLRQNFRLAANQENGVPSPCARHQRFPEVSPATRETCACGNFCAPNAPR
jgi:hypothetical protein